MPAPKPWPNSRCSVRRLPARCLLPANGFYEWRGTQRKRPYWLTPGEGSSLFFAAIWEAYPVQEQVWLSTAVITQAASQRRPLILDAAGSGLARSRNAVACAAGVAGQ
jgi:hypothetical protein